MASATVSCWAPDRKFSDKERWVCIYPAYINSKKTLAEGRRIPKGQAVDNPTYQEIRDVLSAAGFTVGVENKIYSRERNKDILYRGRIRVQLKNDDGTPLNSDYPNKHSILLYLGSTIPKLKTRTQKAAAAESSKSQSSSSSSNKKKGKGGRR